MPVQPKDELFRLFDEAIAEGGLPQRLIGRKWPQKTQKA